jgi:hypothetical protein
MRTNRVVDWKDQADYNNKYTGTVNIERTRITRRGLEEVQPFAKSGGAPLGNSVEF